jgi:bacterioferritin-associated ferredoxin
MEKNKIIICPYEEVTMADIHKCLEMGFTTVEDIKRLTRVGMGPCQGRDCIHIVVDEISKFNHIKKSDIELMHIRPNLANIPLKALMEHKK